MIIISSSLFASLIQTYLPTLDFEHMPPESRWMVKDAETILKTFHWHIQI